MTLSGRARLAGVMGWPVAHSLSPRLHGYWLAHHKIDGAYVPLAVRPEDFGDAFRGLVSLGFAGANVTVPHKEEALRRADKLDVTAKAVGAVNTLVVREGGTIEGWNTDVHGFMANLAEGAPGWRPDRPVAIIGAGGAARAALAGLIAAGVPELRIVNRTDSRAKSLEGLDPRIKALSWTERRDALSGAGLLVNTTTQGMAGQPPLDLTLDALGPDAIVYDIVYVPLITPLIAAAQARGLATVDGLGMLLHQAERGFSAWFGVTPEITPALRHHVLAGLEPS